MADEIRTAPVTNAPTAAAVAPAAAIPATPAQAAHVANAETTQAVHLDLGVANMQAISSNPNVALPNLVNKNDVVFAVKYGKDYKGDRFMPEGNVVVSKESAAHFESIGIGKIIK